jgi:hypothetical protein
MRATRSKGTKINRSKVARGWAPKDRDGILWLYRKKSDLDTLNYLAGTRPVKVVILPLAEYRRLKRLANENTSFHSALHEQLFSED